MAVLLSPVGGVAGQFFDNNGNPLTGGKMYSYVAGTTTPQATYTSSAGVVAHSNPIILDAGGRVPGGEIWLTDGLQYKFVLKNANDVLIGTYDNIVGINSNFVNFLTETEVQTATAGQTVFTLTTMQYQQGTNNLTVYVDGVNQIDGSTYSYVETSPTVVTFTAGLHVGALVKFTTAQTLSTGVTDASLVTYQPAGTGAVATNVQAKLRENVNALDFGVVVGVGVSAGVRTANGTAINTAITSAKALSASLELPAGVIEYTGTLNAANGVNVRGQGNLGETVQPGSFIGTTLAYFGSTLALNMAGASAAVVDRILCTWSDLIIDGTGANDTAEAVQVAHNYRSNPLLRNVTLKTFGGNGLHFIADNWIVSFENLRIDACGKVGNNSGIYAPFYSAGGALNTITFNDCVVEDCGSITSDAGGVNFQSRGSTLNWVNGSIEGNLGTQEIFIANREATTIDGLHLETVGASGLAHYAITFSFCRSARVVGGEYSGAGTDAFHAIRLLDGSNVYIAGVTFYGWNGSPETYVSQYIVCYDTSSVITDGNFGRDGIDERSVNVLLINTSSTSGQVAPRVLAIGNNTPQSLANGVIAKVLFGTEVYDKTQCLSSSAYTPVTLGVHHVSASVAFATAVDQTRMVIAIYKNSLLLRSVITRASGTGSHSLLIAADVPVTAVGDYFEIYALQDSGGSVNLTMAADECWFSAHYVGTI